MASQEEAPGTLNRDFAAPQGEKANDTRSAFASTLLGDAEDGNLPSMTGNRKRKGNLYNVAIDTSSNPLSDHLALAAKLQLLSEAMLDVGMGWYQWTLVVVTAIAWFLDTFWIASFTIILPAAANEAQFFYTYYSATDLMICLWAGLTFGSITWPTMSDRIGRKHVFTSTAVLMGMGGLVGAGMTDFVGLCVVGFIVGFAIGGNQAVDALVLVESLPASHQWLVAMQGVFWGIGELVAYAVGWAFIELYTCGTGPDETSTASSFSRRAGGSNSSSGSSGSGASSCHYVSNKGWRYTWWCFGCITLFLYLLRFFFPLRETPKSLLARRRDAEAVQALKDIACYNKRSTWLAESMFARADTMATKTEEPGSAKRRLNIDGVGRLVVTSLGPLGLGFLMLLWANQGLTFNLWSQFLPLYLTTNGVVAVTATSVTTPYLFSRYVYVAISAIPGPVVAVFLMEAKALGRKRTGAVLALLTGLFMLVSTTSTSRGASLGWQCVLSFLQYANLAVLFTYTVEVFAAPVRGVGIGLTTFSWRFFGMIAWIIAASNSSSNGGAVWFSGALSMVVAVVWILLPKETVAVAAA
ncbi:sugar transporter [Xylariales sp. PMI_506]|nr:sugar transporter [Xylariales sp. PMI_506]